MGGKWEEHKSVVTPMIPDFEQLLQVIRTVAQDPSLEWVHVLVCSPAGDYRFIEVEGDTFRAELEAACREGQLVLGLLAWKRSDGMIQATSMIFPWHKEDPALCTLFKRLCEEGRGMRGSPRVAIPPR